MSKNTLLSELINYISANSSGNVVIAAPSSGYALDVTGTGRFTGDLTIANATANNRFFINRASSAYTSGIFYQTNGTYDFLLGQNPLGTGTSDLSVYSYGTSSVVFNIARATGNVGIGTSSPTRLLNVLGGGSNGILVTGFNSVVTIPTNGLSLNTGYNVGYITNYTAAGAYADLYYSAASHIFSTSDTERMRITSGGSVQIGGTVTTSKLGVTDGAKSSNAVPFTLSSNDGSTSMQLYFQRNINLYYEIQSVEQGVSYRSLYLNLNGGGVYAGTQRIDNNSDIRVKENIQPVTNALSTIMSLSGKKFNMIDEDNILRYGFIAQEVQPVLNDFVTESTRSYMDGDNVIENILTLESSGTAWAALLVEAIKELKSEIDLLKQQ